MKRTTRKSTSGAEEIRNSVGNFSTKFSLPSFLKRVEKLTDEQRNAIQKMGFGHLLLLPNHMLIKNLLVELMERWSTEECAFLLPPGKLKITLMDVALILGLPVTGDPLILEENEPFSDLESDFGAVLWKRKIDVASITSKLDSLGEVVSDEFIRAFLLYVIGTLLFPNATGKVDSRYLSFLTNLDDVCRFAWGAAVLEEIVMWLNRRKATNVQYIGGCLIFLQIWSYEHIDIARPGLLDTHSAFPRACRWENTRSHQRQWFAAKFKQLQDHQVIWKLQPNSRELELSFVTELLEAENETELPERDNSSIDVSILNVNRVEIDSDNDIRTEVEEVEDIDSEETRSSTPCRELEVRTDNVDLALASRDAYSDPTKSNENDMRTGYRRLKEENLELKEENDKLTKVNIVLEEQIVQLQKEIKDLREEKTRADNLVISLEDMVQEYTSQCD